MNRILFWLPFVLLCFSSCTRHEDPRFTAQIVGAAFSGSDKAWLIIKWGELLRTDDGGSTWKTTRIGEDGFSQVSFIDSMRGWAVNTRGEVWRSSDGGQTWTAIGKIEPPKDTVLGKPQQINFWNEHKGWIVDSFSIWCTDDGGVRWIRCFPAKKNERGTGEPGRYFQVTEQMGWIAATNGEVYRTQDGKRSWQRISVTQMPDFTDVFFIDEHTGWLSADPGGAIYRTDDGGKSWNAILKQSSGNNFGIESIFFFNQNEGWAVGRAYPQDITAQPTEGLVLHTTDGGINWQTIPVGQGELFYSHISFVNQKEGWLVGQNNLYRTDDAGRTWSVVLKLPPIT